MDQIDYQPTQFSEYSEDDFKLLVSQQVENYGSDILEEKFDSQRLKRPIADDRYSILEEFRREYFLRRKPLGK